MDSGAPRGRKPRPTGGRPVRRSPGVLDVLGSTAEPAYAARRVAQIRDRVGLPSGVMAGDVTSHEAVLWARGDGEGRLVARLSSGAHVGRVLHGPLVDGAGDHTGRLDLTGLTPGRGYEATLWFEGHDGQRGEVGHLRFRTAPVGRRGTSFVWSGHTAGDGWGINPDLGGMTGYAAMHATNPDFFVHAGDAIHADAELHEEVAEPDGQVWRNLVTPEVAKVAETLTEFRGRHAYNLLDDNVRSMYADVPVVAQWDSHETHRGWYPGQVVADERYTEQRVDVLAARARRAWQEFHPVGTRATHQRGADGFAAARIYRKVERGPLLDLFCLDLRVRRPRAGQPAVAADVPAPPVLGCEQAEWLVREASRSRATWKVVVADLPLGLLATAPPDAPPDADPLGSASDVARVLRGFRDQGVRNVVWLTSAVQHAAVHHYDPERATFTEFDPFWELVAGPIHAGTFTATELDPVFGPRVEFREAADHDNQSPRAGKQFFGHVEIDGSGRLTATLRDARGRTLHRQELDPER